MKRIKEQPAKETYSKTKYWGHHAAHGHRTPEGDVTENIRANPDGLDEAMSLYQVKEADREVQERVRKLLELAKQILTEQQYNVFVMMAVKDPHFTERETAKVLNITPGRVHQLWDKAREKLQRAYEQRTA